MITFKQHTLSSAFSIAAACIAITAAYFYAAREMNIVVIGAFAAVSLLICFFNVRLSLILLILSMLLSPEIIVGRTSARDVTVRFDDVFLLVMTAGWIIRIAVLKDIGLMRRNPLNRPILVFGGCAVLSTTLGVFYETVSPFSGFFFVLKLLEYFFLFSIIVNFVRDSGEVKQLLIFLLLVGGVIGIYGIYKVLSGGDIAAPFEGSMGEKNTLGGYLVIIGSVAGGILLNSESKKEKILLAALLLLCIPVILFSLSRSSWLAGMTSAAVLFFTAKRKSAFFAVVLLLVAVSPFAVPEIVAKRFAFTFAQDISHYHKQVVLGPLRFDTSLSDRLLDYMNVLRNWPRHSVFGFGVTGFYFVDGQFFRILIEMGAAGLIAFIWLLARLHAIILVAIRADIGARLHGMVKGFYAAFWAVIAHALSANSFIIVRIAEPFWCLAALTVICAIHAERDWGREEHRPAAPEFIPSEELLRKSVKYF